MSIYYFETNILSCDISKDFITRIPIIQHLHRYLSFCILKIIGLQYNSKDLRTSMYNPNPYNLLHPLYLKINSNNYIGQSTYYEIT